MICLGNICRSPLAAGLLRKKLKAIGSDSIVESRGFEPYHIGERADHRAIKTAKKNGIDISDHRASLFQPSDFEKFDLIFIMDHNIFKNVSLMAQKNEHMQKVHYIMNISRPGSNMEVPDPYYQEEEKFQYIYNLLDEATNAIIEKYEKNKQW